MSLWHPDAAAMATGLGVTYRPVKHHLHHFRQFYVARYVGEASAGRSATCSVAVDAL